MAPRPAQKLLKPCRCSTHFEDELTWLSHFSLDSPCLESAVLQVPTHRFSQTLAKLMARFPAQFVRDSRGVDGITPVMSKPIRYSGDQVCVGRRLGLLLIQLVADCLHDFAIRALTMTSDAIVPASLASACCQAEGHPHNLPRTASRAR